MSHSYLPLPRLSIPYQIRGVMNNELNELKAPYDVVIVGSGYSGTMVAVHLARAQRGLRVALIDRSKTFGRGVAYGTTDPKHLLNVPADQMGAFPDDIGHFYRWLKAHPANLGAAGIHELRPDAFIPRLVFGDYIQDLLREACALPGTLDIIRDEIVDLTRREGGSFQLIGKSGSKLEAAQVVLALGNFPPGEAERERRVVHEQPVRRRSSCEARRAGRHFDHWHGTNESRSAPHAR